MIVHWVVDGIQVDNAGNYRSSLATNRYRAILPVLGLRELGHHAELIEMADWVPSDYQQDVRPDVVVIGKLLPSPRYEALKERLLGGIETARQSGIKVLADINDDHFGSPVLGPLWQTLVTRTDGIVAGSEAMAEVVRAHTGLPVLVVGDPVGSPLGEPHTFKPAKGWSRGLVRLLEAMGHGQARMRLVWFGTHVNWPSMAGWVGRLVQLASRQPWQLTVITRPGMGIEEFVSGFNAARPHGAMVEFVPWEEDSVWDHVGDAHLVLIPSDLSLQGKAVKSANRLVDALHCGRFVIASPVPAYEAFADCVWLGEDPVVGVDWAMKHADEVLEKLRRGQERVAQEYSIEAIARQWAATFGQFSQAHQEAGSHLAKPVKAKTAGLGTGVGLNLGCVDKTLEGYVNVDMILSRPGKASDILCGLPPSRIWDLYTSWFYEAKVWKEMQWHGIRTLKMPADMWNYQEIIYERGVAHVIETGTRHGGSALFFAETLAACGAPGPVISIDIDDDSRLVREHPGIHFLLGDSASKEMVERARALLPERRGPVFLILDSDHSRPHVYAEMEAWVPLLIPGDYLVVEDTNVNGHPVRPEHGPGPWEAVMDFRRDHPGWLEPDPRRERKFGATAAPDGYYIRK